MALVLKDRVKQTAAAPGTGTITLGATAAGFQSFASVGNGNTTYFAIVDPISGAWEVNYGVYTSSGTTLTRNATPLSSSTGTLVNFTGAVDVFLTYPSEKAVWQDVSGVVVQQSFGAITATSAALTSGTITGAPVNATDIVNKEYADSIASGLNYHQPVNYASTAALPAYTYNNGTSGVGATITANANGALSLGGGSPTATQRVLVKDEVSGNAPYNGIYVVTQAGSAGTPFILTRATDYDTSGTGTNEIDAGDYVLVISGTLASTAWVQQTPLPITVGTTAITFLQFNAPITYTAGTGLNLSPATTFNISNTGVTATTYGSASAVPVVTFNAQGQATGVTNTTIAIAGSQVSGNITGQAGSVANALTLGTYLTGGTYNGSAAVTATVDATSANTASKVVARDSSGNFSAGTITATLSGSSTSATTATNLAGGAANQIAYQSGSGTTTFATAPSASNQVLGWNGSAFSWSTGTISGVPLGSNLNSLTAGTYLTGTAYNGSAAQTWTVNAASANTASTVVARDASGNFSASTITASLSGNATSATNSTTVGGFTPSQSSGVANRVVVADANGYIFNSYFNSVDDTTTNGMTYIMAKFGDNYLRSASAAAVATFISGQSMNIAGNATTATTATNQSGGTINATTGAFSSYVTIGGGDLTVYRTGGTTGVLYLNSAQNRYLYWNSSTYELAGAELNINGNRALNAGNYNSYAPTLTGTGASGTWGINITGSAGSATSITNFTATTSASGFNPDSPPTIDQIGYWTGGYTLYGYNDGGLYTSGYSTSWYHQISGDFRSGQIAVRGKNSGTWQSWYYIPTYSLNNGYSTGSLYAGIYYDSNNTGYYLDPASTSVLNDVNLVNGKWYTSNNESGQSLNIYVRPNGDNTYVWRHIYGGTGSGYGTGVGGYGIYYQTLGGDYNVIYSPSGFATFPYSARSPIFYDSNNTAYYLDAANSASAGALSLNGGITFGIANPYLTASSYIVVPGGAFFNSGTVYVAANLQARGGVGNDAAAALVLTGGTSGYTEINGSTRSPIYYDLNNTSFFVDPYGTSNLTTIVVGYNSTDPYVYNVASTGVITFGTTSDLTNYSIQTALENYAGNYSKLRLKWYTGIQHYASPYYGGHRFYDITGGTEYFGVAVGGTNNFSYSTYSHRAPLFYDLDNTGYYVDPASTSVLSTLLCYGNVTAYYSSDIKFKTNVRDIPNALEIAESIGGKLFDWTDEYIEEHGGEDDYFMRKADFGVIAQDVLKVFPVAVRTRPDGSLAVDYEKLSAIAFAAVASLSTRVKSLEARI